LVLFVAFEPATTPRMTDLMLPLVATVRGCGHPYASHVIVL
jgi:hypothetical protein